MASHEDDNKLKLKSNINIEQEINHIDVKKYDAILNSKDVNFEVKVQNLIEVWKNISELNLKDFESIYVLQIVDWAKLHALNIVLMGEWRKTKEESHDTLLEAIKKAQDNLNTRNKSFGARCQKLLDVVKNPWEDPILNALLNSKDAEIGAQEIEFFCVETAYLISVRLKKLCENHCEDLALNLTTNFLKCNKLSKEQNFTVSANETQIWYIVDTHIALLYKFHDKARIIRQFEELELKDGVELIKRFSKKRVQISKIWKHCHKIAMFGARFFLSKALMNFSVDTRQMLLDLMKVYIHLSNTEALTEEFIESVRSITNLADAAGLCALCEIIHQEAGEKLRHFAIEMYIRALTTDMNEMERLKHQNEHEKVDPTSRLADSFMNLSELLDKHVNVARECVLTAFSLNPTKNRLQKIKELGKRSGFKILDTGQEWKCKLHPPVLPTDDLAWKCSECGDWMCKPTLTTAIQTNFALNEALQPSALGISQALCDDLVVCLSNPRYQVLSWLLDWNDLYRLCIMYLNDPEKTKNFVTELKFVDIDYSQFQHIKKEPLDEFSGIEKGYEQYLDLDFVSDEEYSASEESRDSQYSSSKTTEDSLSSILPQKAESNPVTLKSLRMFRPNLKRKKEQESEPQTELKKVKLPASAPMSTDSNANNMYVNKSEVKTSTNTTMSTKSSFEITSALKPHTCTKPAVNNSNIKNVNKMDSHEFQYISSVNKNSVLKSSIKTYSSSNVYKKPTVAPFLGATTAARNYEAELLRNFADTVNSSYKTHASKQTNQTLSSKTKNTTVTTTALNQQKRNTTITVLSQQKNNTSELDLFDNFIRELTESKNSSIPTELKQNITTTTATTTATETTESKNVEAATLLRLGGQLVAQTSHQPIQVPLLPKREPTCSTHETQDNNSAIQGVILDKLVQTKKRSRSLENANNNFRTSITRSRTLERGNQSCNQEFLRDLVSSQTPRCRELQVRLTPIPSVQMEQLLQSKQIQTASLFQQHNTRKLQPLQESLLLKQMGQKLVVMLERLTPRNKLSKKRSCLPVRPLTELKPQPSIISLPQVDPELIIRLERKVPSLIVQVERLLYSEQLQKRNIPLQTAPAYSLRPTSLRPWRQNYSRTQKSMPSSLKEPTAIRVELERPPPPPETSLLYKTENQVCARLRLQTAKNMQSFSTASTQEGSSHMPVQTIQPVIVPAQDHLLSHSSRCSPPIFRQQQPTDIHFQQNQQKTTIMEPYTPNQINAMPKQPQVARPLHQDQESNQELSLPHLPPIILNRLALSPFRQEVKLDEELLLPPLLTVLNSLTPPPQDLEPNQQLIPSPLQTLDNPTPSCHLKEDRCRNTALPSVLDPQGEVKSFRQETQMTVPCNTPLPSPIKIPVETTSILTIQTQTAPHQWQLELVKGTQVICRNLAESEQASQIVIQAISRQSHLKETPILELLKSQKANSTPVQALSHQEAEPANQTSTLIALLDTKLNLKKLDPKSYELPNQPKSLTAPLGLMDHCLESPMETTKVPLQTFLNKPQTLLEMLPNLASQTTVTLRESHIVDPVQYLSQIQLSHFKEQQPLCHNPILPCLLFPSQNQITEKPVKVILSKSSVESLLSGFIKNQVQPMGTLNFNTHIVKKQNKPSNYQMKIGDSTLTKILDPMDGNTNHETQIVCRNGISNIGKFTDKTKPVDFLEKIDNFFKINYESIDSEEIKYAIEDVDQIFSGKKSYKSDIDTDDDIIDGFSDVESDSENIKEMCQRICTRLYSDLITEHNFDIGDLALGVATDDDLPLDLTFEEMPLNLSSRHNSEIDNKDLASTADNDLKNIALGLTRFYTENVAVDLTTKTNENNVLIEDFMDISYGNSSVHLSINENINLDKQLLASKHSNELSNDVEMECKLNCFIKTETDLDVEKTTNKSLLKIYSNKKTSMESCLNTEDISTINNHIVTEFISAEKNGGLNEIGTSSFSDFNKLASEKYNFSTELPGCKNSYIRPESNLTSPNSWNIGLENLDICKSTELVSVHSNSTLNTCLESTENKGLKEEFINSATSCSSDLVSDDNLVNSNMQNNDMEQIVSSEIITKDESKSERDFVISDSYLKSDKHLFNSNIDNIHLVNLTDNANTEIFVETSIDDSDLCSSIGILSGYKSDTLKRDLVLHGNSNFEYKNNVNNFKGLHTNIEDFTSNACFEITPEDSHNNKESNSLKESIIKSGNNACNYVDKISENNNINFEKQLALEDVDTMYVQQDYLENVDPNIRYDFASTAEIKNYSANSESESNEIKISNLKANQNFEDFIRTDMNSKSTDSGLEFGSNEQTYIKPELSDTEYENSSENSSLGDNSTENFCDNELSDSDTISELFWPKKSIYLKTNNGDDLDELCRDLEKELAREYFGLELNRIERATDAMGEKSFSAGKYKATQTLSKKQLPNAKNSTKINVVDSKNKLNLTIQGSFSKLASVETITHPDMENAKKTTYGIHTEEVHDENAIVKVKKMAEYNFVKFIEPEKKLTDFLRWRARRRRERMARKMRLKLKNIYSSIQTGLENERSTEELLTLSDASSEILGQVDIEEIKFCDVSGTNSSSVQNLTHVSAKVETSPKLLDNGNLEYSVKDKSVQNNSSLGELKILQINAEEFEAHETEEMVLVKKLPNKNVQEIFCSNGNLVCAPKKINYYGILPTGEQNVDIKQDDLCIKHDRETEAVVSATDTDMDTVQLKTDYDLKLEVERDPEETVVILNEDFENFEKENRIVFSADESSSEASRQQLKAIINRTERCFQEEQKDVVRENELAVSFSNTKMVADGSQKVFNFQNNMDDGARAISSSDSEDKTDSSDRCKIQIVQDNASETLKASSDDNIKEILCKMNQITEMLVSQKPEKHNNKYWKDFIPNSPKPAGDLAAMKYERLFDKNDDWMVHLKICHLSNSTEVVQTARGTKRKSNFLLNCSSDSEDEDIQRNILNFDFLIDRCKVKPNKLCAPSYRKQKQRQAKSKEAREKYLDTKYKIPSLFAPPKSKKTKQDKHKKEISANFKQIHFDRNAKNNELDKSYACFDMSDRIKEVEVDVPTQPLINVDEYLQNRKKGEPLPTAKEFLTFLTDQRIVNAVLRNVPGLYDLNFMTPRHIEHIVNVAQVSGTRTQSVTSQNSQTSTQVTPHIQRIGQPVTRVIEHKPPEVSLATPALISSTTSTAVGITQPKPVSNQPTTLINILSQQIRPGQNIVRTVKPATGPLINILSQQIIRPGPVGAPLPQVQKVVVSSDNLASTELLQPTVIKSETGTGSTVASTIITTKPINAIANSTSKVLTSSATPSQSGTILQFICKSSLPKFQQAFGKCVSYQKLTTTVATDVVNPTTTVVVAQASSVVQTSTTSASSSTVTATLTPVAPLTIETKKLVPTKTIPISMQPLTSNVIYRGQVPVGQTISLIPPGGTTRQLFRITGTTNDQMTLVKETVIQNKMHALLAAALQAKPKTSQQESNGQTVEVPPTRITLCKPNTPGTITNARIVKPVQVQIPTGATIRSHGSQSNNATNVSSTTLEQLREFDMVYKQVKERSSTSSTTSEATNSPVEAQDCPPQPNSQPQRISFAYVQNPVQKFTQLSPVVVVSSYNHLPTATSGSPTLTVISQGNSSTQAATCTLPKIASKNLKNKSSKSSTAPLINHMIKAAATIPKAPPKPQEDEQTTQRIFDILAEYAEQLRNSPDLNNKPAPRRRSNPPTNPGSSSKRRKSSTSKKTGTNSSVETDTDDWTMGSEDSSNGNVAPSSATDDEQSQQAAPISSPPEPQTPQPQVLTEYKTETSQTTSVPMTPTAAVTVTSTTNTRPFIMADPNQPTNVTQPRNVIISDSSVGVGEALKIPNTALIVPGSYIVPVSMVKGTQQIVQISGGNKFLTTMPTRPGQNMLVFQGFLNQNRKVGLQTVKYSTIQPLTSIATPNIAGIAGQQQVVLPPNVLTLGQPLALKKFENGGNKTGNEIFLTISQPREPTTLRKVIDKVSSSQPDSSTNVSSEAVEIKIEDIGQPNENATIKVIADFPKTSAVATSVIASCIKEEIIDHNTPVDIITDDDIKMEGTDQEIKVEESRNPGERIKSVLVNASSSNGPMLSHTNSRYRKRSESAETIISSSNHNGEKVSINNEPKIFNTKSYFRTKKHVISAVNKKLESEMQKQAALERELRLQKSLSEECEDLGVDEPSTSDLFPEADLLFDANHSPAYEHTEMKKTSHSSVSKTGKGSNMIFSDDENSGPMQADVLFDYVEYPVTQTIDYPPRLLNGNTESVSSCDDNTLLSNTSTMQEVTLNSPISADIYTDTQPTNKYKYKYSNRKRNEKNSKSESPTVDKTEVSTDVDVAKSTFETSTGVDNSIEKSIATNVVSRFGVSAVQKEFTDSKCEIHCKADEDPKRGTRRSLKKPCACCNGSKYPTAPTLPKKRPLTPSKSPKRALPNKKR